MHISTYKSHDSKHQNYDFRSKFKNRRHRNVVKIKQPQNSFKIYSHVNPYNTCLQNYKISTFFI